MAVTLIGSPATTILQAVAPVVEVKRSWTDAWQFRPDLQVIDATAATAGQDLGRLSFRYRYGKIRQPYIGDHQDITSDFDLYGSWVRVSVMGDEGMTPIWVGRISTETRRIFGGSPLSSGSGRQEFTAYEPLQLVRKIHVSNSYWRTFNAGTNDVRQLGWVPSMNIRNPNGTLKGNRTELTYYGFYAFSGIAGDEFLWTRKQFLEYLIHYYLDGTGGVSWSLGGQADALDQWEDSIEFGRVDTLDQMIRKLIPLKYGLDYKIIPGVSGFEIFVYSLHSSDISFGGASLPKNPNSIIIDSQDDVKNLNVTVQWSQDQRYDSIEVLGNRMVSCFSLDGTNGEVVKRWSDTRETEYKAGLPASGLGAEEYDKARKRESFRPVYQHMGVPDDWNFQGGTLSPAIDSYGEWLPPLTKSILGQNITQDRAFPWQTQVRETLTWLPLRENYDYRSNPPEDVGDTDADRDFLPPIVFLYDPDEDQYIKAEEVGVGVSVSRTDWSVFLSSNPNHLLAKNHWVDANDTDDEPVYDYEKSVITMAIETDHRARVVYSIGDAGDGSKLTIEVPDADFWFLAPHTRIDTNNNHQLVTSGETGRVVKNDSSKLLEVMAGAVARYFNDRGHATIVIEGLHPLSYLIGYVLSVYEAGTNSDQLSAVITQVEWSMENRHQTIIRTGYSS